MLAWAMADSVGRAQSGMVITENGAGLNLSFPTESGFTYQVFYKNNIGDANWTSLNGVTYSGTNGAMVSINDAPPGTCFYQLREFGVPTPVRHDVIGKIAVGYQGWVRRPGQSHHHQ